LWFLLTGFRQFWLAAGETYWTGGYEWAKNKRVWCYSEEEWIQVSISGSRTTNEEKCLLAHLSKSGKKLVMEDCTAKHNFVSEVTHTK